MLTIFLVVACVVGWGLFFLAAFSTDPAYIYLKRDHELVRRHRNELWEENKRLRAQLKELQDREPEYMI